MIIISVASPTLLLEFGKLLSRLPETGAALFNSPTSSSNSEANTDEGKLIVGAYKEKKNSESPEASLRCCK
uniref:Uncharacterized protein n=1 Tax=Varanus komodoensis TaxID=61221 RepID=A0A8D2JH23_VARKO